MMRFENFTYVLRNEGLKPGIKIAIRGWIIEPWKTIRKKVGLMVLSLLKVKCYIED